MHVFCGLSGQWQRTSNIVYGVSERRPLRWKFMKTASALMNGNQNTKVTSTPVSMHMTAKGLCARVRARGERRAVLRSGILLLRNVRPPFVPLPLI